MVGAIFEKSVAVWKQTNLTRARQLQVFEACVQTKLVYGLDTIWLRQAERSRVDAFQASCLRRVYNIPHSYLSRVSNDAVRIAAGRRRLSHTLMERQMQLYRRLVSEPETSLPRRIAIEPVGFKPITFAHRRNRGRPRLQWSTCVYALALDVAGGAAELTRLLHPSATTGWREAVRRYFRL